MIEQDEIAYVCNECGEAFAPDWSANDWPILKRMHNSSHDERPTYTRTTVGEAF